MEDESQINQSTLQHVYRRRGGREHVAHDETPERSFMLPPGIERRTIRKFIAGHAAVRKLDRDFNLRTIPKEATTSASLHGKKGASRKRHQKVTGVRFDRGANPPSFP